MNRSLLIVMVLLAGLSVPAHAQIGDPEELKCGLPVAPGWWLGKAQYLNNWGYGYDSLKRDLGIWKQSPFVKVDSVGTTVLGRTMYVMTIEDTLVPTKPRKRVWIHARTHPCEVQGTRNTNEIINILLSNSPLGKLLRDSCVFNIMPMYNIDGVEFSDSAHYRYNANMYDIESEWGKADNVTQKEVLVLRSVFISLMAKPNPIKIALNMHADYRCERFFWMHAAGGTSAAYAAMEQQFITLVGANFPVAYGNIKPYTFAVSWATTASTVYPESWFWYNHRENVLALTYEDQNCPTNGNFDKTAYAISKGIAGYLGIEAATSVAMRPMALPGNAVLSQNFPNPFNPTTTIKYQLPIPNHVSLSVFDMLGREVAVLVNDNKEAGNHSATWNASGMPSGAYYFQLVAGDQVYARTMLLVR